MSSERASSDLAVAIVDFGRWLVSSDPEIKAISQLAILDQLKAALYAYGGGTPDALHRCTVSLQVFNNHWVRCDRAHHPDNNHAAKLEGEPFPFSITWQSKETKMFRDPSVSQPCPGCGNTGRNQHYADCPQLQGKP